MELSDGQMKQMYRLLVMGRLLEETLADKARGYHQGVGEEAVLVGAYYGLEENDTVCPHYRGVPTASFVRGADLRKLLGGALGRTSGYTKGRWRGDIHGPAAHGVMGMFTGLLGANLTQAVGIALADKYKGRRAVTLATFGDGTSNEGAFHEAVNMAACFGLPVVFICQNNQWAITTRAEDAIKCNTVADRAAAYGIPGEQVDGNDVVAVHQAVQKAVARARAGQGPSLVEAFTYRIRGHFNVDPGAYQPQEEVARWAEKDPIKVFEAKLDTQGVLTGAEMEAIRAEVQAQLDQAFEQAQGDPEPGAADLGIGDVYAPPQVNGGAS